MMDDEQLLRYSRHIFLPELDVAGQQSLLNSNLMVIGLGGLGSAALPYLAAAGVGKISLIDDDSVDLSNLPRQIIHPQASLGQSKVQSALRSLSALNPSVQLTGIERRVDEAWLTDVIAQYDLVLDCTDNAAARYALNRAALAHSVPWVSGAAIALTGQVTVFDPRQTGSPCYRCLYPDINQQQLNCSESGVLSPLVGVIGTLQAVEAIKILSNMGTPLTQRLLTFDALTARFREWKTSARTDCQDCANHCH